MVNCAALLALVAGAVSAAPSLSSRGEQPLLSSQGIRLVARSFQADNPVEQFYVSSLHEGAGFNALVLNATQSLATQFYRNGTESEIQQGHARLLSPLDPSNYTNSVVMSGAFNETTHSLTATAGTRFAASTFAPGTPAFNIANGGSGQYAYPYLQYTYDPQFGQWFSCHRRITYGTAWILEWHSKYGPTPEGCYDIVLVPECDGDVSDAGSKPYLQESPCWRDARYAPFPVHG